MTETDRRGVCSNAAMKPTIYDIARESGVSIATVSNVLNNTGRMGPETRRKVLRAVNALGYQRSSIATALAGKKSWSIGALLPDVNNPYFSEIVRGAEDEAFSRGYSVLVCNTDHDVERERAYLRTLRHKQMDGIVIATGTTPADQIAELLTAGIHVILLAREIEGAQVPIVMVDNYQGGYLAARFLLELGHRNLGFIGEPLTLRSARDRLGGFAAAIEEAGAALQVVGEGGFGIEAGARLAAGLLAHHRVTAIFTGNDQLAVGALQWCLEAGFQVPHDISLMSFDDTVFSRIVRPSLTCVAQPIYDLGRQTLGMLIGAIEAGEQPARRVVLAPELMIRDSTGPPPDGTASNDLKSGGDSNE
ncbi:MAG: LacI family transcriptional regulator [Alicyclobacillus sp.]|nr:LacI family transcriptional regulator [Alicyclobacillus sp.]